MEKKTVKAVKKTVKVVKQPERILEVKKLSDEYGNTLVLYKKSDGSHFVELNKQEKEISHDLAVEIMTNGENYHTVKSIIDIDNDAIIEKKNNVIQNAIEANKRK